MTVLQPWTRVRQPVPIPTPPDGDVLTQLDDSQFSELLRSNLMPRETTGAGRDAWDALWETLRGDPALAERSYDVLEEFLQITEEFLESSPDLDGARRAHKFAGQCEMAWNRLNTDRDRTPPLQWAGERAAIHPLRSRHVIARLVGAITRHRSTVLSAGGATPADAELWATLSMIGFDPRDYPAAIQRPAEDGDRA